MNEAAQLSIWIDEYNSHKDPSLQLWERIGKIGEEFGETIEALIGFLGQNPRKGQTHSREDIQKELLDVAVTALCAYEHVTGNQGLIDKALADHFDHLLRRVGLRK